MAAGVCIGALFAARKRKGIWWRTPRKDDMNDCNMMLRVCLVSGPLPPGNVNITRTEFREK